ncbi:hypothetical protein KAR10_02295, partial [bacterium]|nr:hypothetical protein [bacterium]
MKKFLFFPLFISFIIFINPLKTWGDWVQDHELVDVVDSDYAHYPYISSSNGTPYVSWWEDNGISYQGYVGYDNGADWITIGTSVNIDPTKDAWYPRIAFDNTTPYVVFYEGNGISYQVRVKFFNGSNWELKGESLNRDPTLPPNWARITFSGSTPYVAWSEPDASSQRQVYVDYFNGTNWEELGDSLNVNPFYSAGPSDIAICNGTPFMVWHEVDDSTLPTDSDIYVKFYNGSDWERLGDSLNKNPDMIARDPTIAFSDNTPYVTWSEEDASDLL